MAQGINLLPEVTEQEVRKDVYKRKLNVVSIAALLAVALILLGIFAYQLSLKTLKTRAERESKNLEEQISFQKEKEIAQRALVDKLDQIDKLLDEAIPVSSAVANVSNLAKGSGRVTITALDVKSDGDVDVSGKASDSNTLGKFFNALISTNIQNIFDEVTLTTLSGERGEPYNFTINMDFKLKGLKKNETF